MTMTLNLRNVDRDLVKRAKRAAIDRDLTLRQFILDTLAEALPPHSEFERGERKAGGRK